MNYYAVKITFFGTDSEGMPKKLSQQFVVKETGYTEAEAAIPGLVSSTIKSYDVVSIVKMPIIEHIAYADEGTGHWYKCRATIFYQDEGTGKEKRMPQNFLVYATSVGDAFESLAGTLDGSVHHFRIDRVELTMFDSVNVSVAEQVSALSERLDALREDLKGTHTVEASESVTATVTEE